MLYICNINYLYFVPSIDSLDAEYTDEIISLLFKSDINWNSKSGPDEGIYVMCGYVLSLCRETAY